MLIFCAFFGIIGLLIVLALLPKSFSFRVSISYDGKQRLALKISLAKRKKEYIWDEPDFSVLSLFHNITPAAGWLKTGPQTISEWLAKVEVFRKYRVIIDLLFRFMMIKKISWRTSLGLDDAYQTAISSGYLWAVKGATISILSSQSSLNGLTLEVIPDYLQIGVDSNFECIFKLRLVHIIRIQVHLWVLAMRRKVGFNFDRLTANGGIYKWINNRKIRDIRLKG